MKSLTMMSPYVFLLFCFFVIWQFGFDKILLVLAAGLGLYALVIAGIGLFLAAILVEDKIIRKV